MLTCLLVLSAVAVQGQSLAFRNVTVVDANGSRPKSNVVIAGGRVVAAGPGATIPSGTRTVDGKGKFLIPGLWDMHVRLSDKNPATGLYVAAGVLGVRDMGSDLKRTRELREKIAAGRVSGPLIYTSGPSVEGPESAAEAVTVVRVIAPGDGDRVAENLYMSFADFIGVTSGVPADAYRSLAYRARVRRLPFAGEVPEGIPVIQAVDARQRSIDGLSGLAIACSLEESSLLLRRMRALTAKDEAMLREVNARAYATFNAAIATELFRRMARLNVWQTPLLSQWKQSGAHRDDLEFHTRLIPYIRQAGAGVLAGSGAGRSGTAHGSGLHDELHALVEAGLTPAEALASATVQPARYFNLEATHGTVERGKVANLVLLDADPMADIRNTTRITAVVNNGKLIERPCLDKLQAGRQDPCAFVSSIQKAAPSSPKPRRSSRKRGSRAR